jgi:hypothetical protein
VVSVLGSSSLKRIAASKKHWMVGVSGEWGERVASQ